MGDQQSRVNHYKKLIVDTLTGQESGLTGYIPEERLDFQGWEAVWKLYTESDRERGVVIEAMRSIIDDGNQPYGVQADLILLARSLPISGLEQQVITLLKNLPVDGDKILDALRTEASRYLRDVPNQQQ